jgi:alpha-L-fucosidase
MMKTINYLPLCIIFSALLSLTSNGQEMYQPTWESLSNYKCPDWFRDAKFGIFIHWGVYSVPGFSSEWYPRQMYDRKDTAVFNHHVRTYGPQDKFGYKDFIPMFRAEKFNADQWIDIFKRSGAKYIVPVAEHHDGFAMYNTSLSKWNAYNMGPKRDIIGELATAARKGGLIFGLSSHRIEHWFFMGEGMKFNSDVKDHAYYDFYGPARNEDDTVMSAEHMNDWLLRCCELVDKYHPQLFWFDWYIERACLEPYRKTFAAYYYNHASQWNQEVVINFKNKAFPDNAAVYDIERGSSRATRKYPWQTDTSMGKKSWGWISDEENKTPDEIIDALIDIVSKNGNLLLNIGPKPDGTISDEQVKVLLTIGEWLKINGEGIYGTRPWRISGEGKTIAVEGSFGDQKAPVYTPEDIRFTSKDNIIYAFCLDVPVKTKIYIKSLGSGNDMPVRIKSIELLGSSEKIRWSQKKDLLVIDSPKSIPCREAVGFKILLEE